MHRTRTTSVLSSTENDIIHKLRPRINLTNHYVGNSATEDASSIKHDGSREGRELRSSARLNNVNMRFYK